MLCVSEGRGRAACNQGASVPASKSSWSLKWGGPCKQQVSFCLCSTPAHAYLPARLNSQPEWHSPLTRSESLPLLSNKLHQQPTLALFLPPFSIALAPHVQWAEDYFGTGCSYIADCICMAHGCGASSAIPLLLWLRKWQLFTNSPKWLSPCSVY